MATYSTYLIAMQLMASETSQSQAHQFGLAVTLEGARNLLIDKET